MPKLLLSDAMKGSSAYLFLIVGGLLIISLIACVIISRRYLCPIKEGLSSIREKQNVQGEMESLQEEHKKARSEIARLAYSRKELLRYAVFMKQEQGGDDAK